MRPAFKKTLRPIIRKGQVIEINYHGTATEIDDPDGNIYELLELLDGSRSISEIANHLNLPIEDIEDAIIFLNELHYIEDTSVPKTYSPTELDRYQANLNYFSGYANLDVSRFSFQDKLKDAKIAILGLGGGSLAAAYLAGLGVGEIVGLDYDKVERTNLNRQFLYNEDDIGRLKSEVAEEKIKKINPEISVKMYNQKVGSYEDLLDILDGADAVINALDQPAIISARWVNAACVKLGIPFYRGGINNQSIMWERINPLNQEPCYDCKILYSLESDHETVYRLESGYGKTFSGVNTGFAPNLSILIGLFISDIVNLITGAAPLFKPNITVDTILMNTLQSENEKPDRHPDCPTCSNQFNEMASIEHLKQIVFGKGALQ
ncbi:ThiF family adenylyltransferase [Neobacillus sp. YIM B06451]|uniref:ThiF family adenylyltransferase n=1 Tax=Neobacillus sp. YIM B06451 TaxID=3070994 RepID=UPI0029305C97|nr:ThiF family adenylyltransferase [Neobacillus sp. YIM B06451]